MERQRNYGVDLYKIVAMLLVVILHILGEGGALAAAGKTGIKTEIAWTMEVAAYCAVNCYALASGYVGVKSRYRYSNLIILWLRVLFYSIGITAVYAFLLRPSAVGIENWKKAFTPVTSGMYWYFTSYVGLFLFLPVLNKGMETMDRKQAKCMIQSITVFFFVASAVFGQTYSLNGGYSAWWLMIVYLVGAYIGRFDFLPNTSKKTALLGYIAVVAIAVIMKFAFIHFSGVAGGKATALGKWFLDNNGKLIKYTSITVLLESVFLFKIFYQLELPEVVKKVVGFLVPMSFSVYLIHVHPMTWDFFMHKRYSYIGKQSPLMMVLGVLGHALLIYLVCSGIDYIREVIFKVLGIKKRLIRIEECLLSDKKPNKAKPEQQ